MPKVYTETPIQDVKVGDTVYFPTMGERKVTEILTDVLSCRHGKYAKPQIAFHYENEAWGNNWCSDTKETIAVLLPSAEGSR